MVSVISHRMRDHKKKLPHEMTLIRAVCGGEYFDAPFVESEEEEVHAYNWWVYAEFCYWMFRRASPKLKSYYVCVFVCGYSKIDTPILLS